jgi:hypothetical protein
MNASELIDKRIAELSDWRGQRIAHIRQLVREAAPDIVEEWKWDTPVWSHHGNVLAVGAFQDHVKINFFHGALLEDRHLFNAGLEAKATRAIDIFGLSRTRREKALNTKGTTYTKGIRMAFDRHFSFVTFVSFVVENDFPVKNGRAYL